MKRPTNQVYFTDYHTQTPNGRMTQGRFRSEAIDLGAHLRAWKEANIPHIGPPISGPSPYVWDRPSPAQKPAASHQPKDNDDGKLCPYCRSTDTFWVGYGQITNSCRCCRGLFTNTQSDRTASH